MELNTLKRLKIELDSFKLLTTANMFGAAISLAYGIAYGASKIIPYISGSPFPTDNLPYILVGICVFATAFSWITRSSELMDKHGEIVKELDKIIGKSETEINEEPDIDENVLGILVRSIAFYRENSSKIQRLKWGGRLTGFFILVIALPQLISFLNGTYPVDSVYVLAQLFVVFFSVCVSIAAWYVPVVIKRFMDTWDVRLKLADDANDRLAKILEGNG